MSVASVWVLATLVAAAALVSVWFMVPLAVLALLTVVSGD